MFDEEGHAQDPLAQLSLPDESRCNACVCVEHEVSFADITQQLIFRPECLKRGTMLFSQPMPSH